MDEKQIAVKCFNEAWNFLGMEELDSNQKAELLNLVHSSRYHWGQIGTDLERSRGEWQISRAYVKCGFYEPALLHANQCLKYTLKAELRGFDIAFAYESVARSKMHLGLDFEDDYATSMKYAEAVESKDDREYAIAEISTIRG